MGAEFDVYVRRNTWLYALDPRVKLALVAEAILITRGEEGMTLVERRRKGCFHIPALARQVYDVTGAGDTVIAVGEVENLDRLEKVLSP